MFKRTCNRQYSRLHVRLNIGIIYLFVISRALQGHSDDVCMVQLLNKLFTVLFRKPFIGLS